MEQESNPVILSAPERDAERPCDSVIVVIPAYNEERFIGTVVLQARRHVHCVVVVDDGSSDNTAKVAELAGAIVRKHASNQGKGAALNTGFDIAREYHPTAVVTMDADGQHQPDEMERVLAPVFSGEADIVVGSRYLEQTSNVPGHRVIGHRVFNLLTNVTSGTRATDSQSGFRAFSNRALEAIRFASEGFSVESEMQFLARDHHLVYKEVPITIRYPDKPKRSVVRHGLFVLDGVLRLVGQRRPLMYFGVPSFAVLVTGLAWGMVVIRIYREVQELAIGYTLLAVLLTILGTLGLFAGLLLHSIRGILLDLLQDRANGSEKRSSPR